MAYPPFYDRLHNFADEQAAHPSDPLPADWLEEELNAVKISVDGTIDSLKRIQRSDGAVANKSIGYDQLKNEVRVGIRQPTVWVDSSAYVEHDVVSYGPDFYACVSPHTSSDNFASDQGDGRWVLILDLTSVAGYAQVARDAAIAAQEAAEGFRDEAETFASSASNSASSATASAGAASTSATAASASASAASTSADGASVAKDAAEVAQGAAETAAEDAQYWAGQAGPIAYADLTGKPTLGTLSSQDAGTVAITGGSIAGIIDLAVVDGGTGASDASGARDNLGIPAYIYARGHSLTPRMFGAVGNGDPANSAADTAGLQAAIDAFFGNLPGSPNTPGPVTTLDLQGGCYILENGLLAPTLSYVSRFAIQNGLLQLKDSVTAGTEDMLDLRPLTMLYQGSIKDVFFNGFKSDNTVLARTLLAIPNARVFRVNGGGFACFTDYGFLGDTADYGQAISIIDTAFQGYIGSGTFPASSTGVYFKGGDNRVVNTTVGDCNTLVHFEKDSCALQLCHIWNYSTTSIAGVVCDIAKGMQINSNYIDTVKLILKGAASGGYHFNGNNITSNKFYLPPGGTGTARGSWTSSTCMIEYAPQTAGSEVSQDVILGNSFKDDGGTVPVPVGVDTTNGTITAVSGFTLAKNRHYGFQERYSDPWGHISISSGTSGTKDFSSLIPFGAVQRVKGASLQTTTNANLWFGVSGNVVTATVSASLTGTVRVQASINSAEGD